MGNTARTTLLHYGGAAVFTALAVLLRWLLDPPLGDHLPLVTLVGAVAAAVWLGGYRPALIAVVFGYLACAYLFIEPRGTLGSTEARHLVGLVAYLVTCSIIIGFGEAMHASRRRADQQQQVVWESQQKFSTFFHASPIAMSIATLPDGVTQDVNPAWERLTGFTRNEAVGKTSIDLGLVPRPQVREQVIKEQRRHGVVRNAEISVVTRSGTPRTVLINLNRVEIDGRPFLLSTNEDITDRKQAEDQLRQSERRERERAGELEALLDAVPTPVFIAHDAECRHISGNQAADLLLRNPRGGEASLSAPDPVRPRHFKAVKDGRELAIHELPAQRAARGEPIKNFEFSIVFEDGAVHQVLGYGTPLFDEQGRPRGAVHVLVDITERKHAEEALRDSERQLVTELADARRLQAVSGRLVAEGDVAALYEQIRDAAAALMRSDAASLQALDPATNELRLLTWAGFAPESAAFWGLVRAASPPTCGAALARGERVVVPDVEACDFLAGTPDLAEYRRSGLRGMQSTPLRARDGRLLGVISTYWRRPHEPPERELRLLDVLARQAADLLERRQAEEALRQSERRLRLALAAARMGIWTLDLDTGTQMRDGNLNRLLGLEPVDTTQPFEEFLTHVHPDDRPGVREAFAASMREGRLLNVEFRVVLPGGAVRWLRDQGDVFGDALIGARRMAGACVDVSDRVEAEARVRASEGRLRQILASATDFAIVTLDAARRVTGWSPGAAAVFGYPEAEMLGRLGDEVFTPEDRAARQPDREAEQARREGRAADERWHVRKGGQRFYASGVMTPLGDGFVKVLRDLTDRKRMEDELREAARRKDEFLAMLGHELRNPLAPLRSLAEVLRRQELDGETLERAHAMMERQVGHLARLVDDLLDVSRITRGLVELRKEPADLAEIAGQAVEMATPAVEGRGHDLNLSLPRKPLRVEGDAARLTQVVFNLLNNAAKYTDPGGKIWLTAEREGEEAVVRVRDNGSGMKAELLPKVFDLFAQGDRALDRSQGGLGLGLTLVRRLVEMHGGTVEARSEGPGKGSEFTLRLPALPAEEAKPPPARPAGPPQAAVQVARALVIDDNLDVAESMTWTLGGLAREIKMVHSGQAALEVAPEFHPDVIVCDIGMPGMDGYETCRRLRQLPGLGEVVIAAVSGYGAEEDRQKSREAGFDRHLVKPIGRAILEELVQSAAKDR
jgi:PAS domain S-box-containing protein